MGRLHVRLDSLFHAVPVFGVVLGAGREAVVGFDDLAYSAVAPQLPCKVHVYEPLLFVLSDVLGVGD